MSFPVLLPNNSTAIERALAQLDADGIGGLDAQIIRRVHSIDETPEKFLPFLAWERSVDEWNVSWSVEVKREVVRKAYEVHRFKGTAWAVIEAIKATGMGAKVEEWFEYDGDPYKFRLTIDLTPTQVWLGQDIDTLVRTALKTKNARSFLENVIVRRQTTSPGPFVGGFIAAVQKVFIGSEAARDITTSGYLFIGGFVRSRQIVSLSSEA